MDARHLRSSSHVPRYAGMRISTFDVDPLQMRHAGISGAETDRSFSTDLRVLGGGGSSVDSKGAWQRAMTAWSCSVDENEHRASVRARVDAELVRLYFVWTTRHACLVKMLRCFHGCCTRHVDAVSAPLHMAAIVLEIDMWNTMTFLNRLDLSSTSNCQAYFKMFF